MSSSGWGPDAKQHPSSWKKFPGEGQWSWTPIPPLIQNFSGTHFQVPGARKLSSREGWGPLCPQVPGTLRSSRGGFEVVSHLCVFGWVGGSKMGCGGYVGLVALGWGGGVLFWWVRTESSHKKGNVTRKGRGPNKAQETSVWAVSGRQSAFPGGSFQENTFQCHFCVVLYSSCVSPPVCVLGWVFVGYVGPRGQDPQNDSQLLHDGQRKIDPRSS